MFVFSITDLSGTSGRRGQQGSSDMTDLGKKEEKPINIYLYDQNFDLLNDKQFGKWLDPQMDTLWTFKLDWVDIRIQGKKGPNF